MAFVNFRKTDFLSGQSSAREGKVVIAVDGPAASGKGTLARKLAERLGYAFLDTGALYRAVAMATLEIGGDPSVYEDVKPALQIIKRNLTQELLDNPMLRGRAVAEAASQVAAIPEVRLELLDYQREFAKNPPGNVGGAVLDGRDIGTVVCPEADIKFFVTASAEERAKRRYSEFKDKEKNTSYEQILADLKIRDARDQSRKIAPTIAADDAYVLDNTSLSPAQTVDEAVAIIRAKFIEQSDETPLKKA
jgi:cytidylate kinase